MRSVHLWGAVALMGLISLLFVALIQPSERTRTVPETSTSSAAARPVQAADLSGRWAISWTAKTHQMVGQSATDGRVTVAGQVVMTPLLDGRVSLRFEAIDTLQMHIGGADTRAPADALLGHHLIFSRAPSGAPHHFWTRAETPPGFAHLATAIARRMTALRADTATEITPLGEAQLTFDGATRARRYTRLTGVDAEVITGDSRARVTADHIEDLEALVAGRHRVEVRFVAERVGPAPQTAPAFADLVAHVPGTTSAAGVRRDLEKQAGALTRQRLLDTLRGFAAAGTSPDSEWLWRAVGRLRLTPELAGELGALLPGLSPFGQALIADLLASAGSPQAQAALRAALNDPALIASPVTRARLLQRLGFVDAPTPETLAFVEEMAGDEDVRVRRAAHLTRGGLARRTEDPTPIIDALTQATRADDPAEARAAIAGLGNSAHPDAAPTIFEHADAQDPAMRRTAAQALRNMPDADDTLVGMAGDPVSTVQQAALAALNQRPPTSAAADGLSAGLRDGSIQDSQRNQILSLAERGSRDEAGSATWRPVLEALLARSQGDPRLAARARRLLNRPQGS